MAFKPRILDHAETLYEEHGKEFTGRGRNGKVLASLASFPGTGRHRPEWEKDVWNLDHLGFEVRQNPIQMIRTIRFTGIR